MLASLSFLIGYYIITRKKTTLNALEIFLSILNASASQWGIGGRTVIEIYNEIKKSNKIENLTIAWIPYLQT